MTDHKNNERALWAWTLLASIGIAVADSLVPSRFSFEFAYVLPVLLSLQSVRESFAYYSAFVNTCLLLCAMFASLGGRAEFGVFMANHLLAVGLIWAAAFLCALRHHSIAVEAQRSLTESQALIENEELRRVRESLQCRNEELAATRDAAVYTLAKVCESRDVDTGRHLERICAYSLILARELRKDPSLALVINDEFLTNLRQSSPLHDIGKVAVRDEVLQKPGPLTPEEREEMQKHATSGFVVLQDAISNNTGAGFLEMAAVIARYHHERFDGQGYPSGLSGRAIPLAARIVAVADVYDALTSERPYKEACPSEEARDIIVSGSGTHFDPLVVEAFCRRFDDFMEVQRRYPGKYAHINGLTESLIAELCT